MQETRKYAAASLRGRGARTARFGLTLLLVAGVWGCASAASPSEPAAPELLGPLTRAEVEEAVPEWVGQQMESSPDLAAVQALTEVEPGAEVTVYLGTWCGDSKREVSRLWRGFDDAGVGMVVEMPFGLRFLGVDGDKEEPAELLDGVGVEYVPTFIVRREGEEVGRVVEISPNGIEHDLLALLSGEAEGVLSGREDMGGAGREAILGGGDDDGDEGANPQG